MKELELEIAVVEYNLTKSSQSREKLTSMLHVISQKIAEHFHKWMEKPYADEVMQQSISLCLEKVGEYDRNKSRAFNYFTTLILSLFNQMRIREFNDSTKF